jgi:acyl-coenzyme A thioesterase 13
MANNSLSPTPSASTTFDTSSIAGNASPEVKAHLGNIKRYLESFLPSELKRKSLFAQSTQDKLEVLEISILPKVEEPKKLEGRVIVELDVSEGLCAKGFCCRGS